MAKNNLQLRAGQNLRYIGKGFPGYVKGQPYMMFIADHNVYQVLVEYNGANIVIDKYFIEAIR
ncbi:MAG: hypothetical protein ACXVB0_20950 [Mucilaginibacter sp.]